MSKARRCQCSSAGPMGRRSNSVPVPRSDISSNIKAQPQAKCVDTPRIEKRTTQNESIESKPPQRCNVIAQSPSWKQSRSRHGHVARSLRFRDHSKKLKTITVPGDVASPCKQTPPRTAQGGCPTSSRRKGSKESRQCSHRERAHPRRPLRRPARMADRQRRDPSVLVRKQADRPTGQEYCASLRHQTSRAIWQGYQRVASGVAAQGRSHGKKVARCDPTDRRRVAAPLLPFAEIISFGLNPYGGAKKGKSLALNAGGSVIGLGREETY